MHNEMMYRTAILSDAYSLAPRLREADLLECSGHGVEPLAALVAAVEGGIETLTGIGREGDVLGMCGVGVQIAPGLKSIWMLGTDALFADKAYRRYLKLNTAKRIKDWLDTYGALGNTVHSENSVHILWLERLGFKLYDDIPYVSKTGAIFIPFKKETPDV